MTVIDNTYFQYGDMRIGQIGSQEVKDAIQWYIENNEPEVLRLLLGPTLYASLIAAIEAAGTNPDDIVEPYHSLLYGADFLAPEGWGSAQTRHWDGLRSQKNSLVAKYVYFYYLRSKATFLTGSGPTVPKLENATRVSTNGLQRFQWNAMVHQNMSLFAYLRANIDQFPDWPYMDLIWWRRHYFRYGFKAMYSSCSGQVVTPLENLFIEINDLNL